MTNEADGASQTSDHQPSANISNQGTQSHHNPPLDRAINNSQATRGQPENEVTKHQPPASILAPSTAFLPTSEGPSKQVGPVHCFLAKSPSHLPFPSSSPSSCLSIAFSHTSSGSYTSQFTYLLNLCLFGTLGNQPRSQNFTSTTLLWAIG